MSVRRFLSYNVYIASVYTFLRVRYQARLTRTSSPVLRKLFPFTGAALPFFSVDNPFLNFFNIKAYTPYLKRRVRDEAEELGLKLRDKTDLEMIKDIKFIDQIYVSTEGISPEEQEAAVESLLKHKDKNEPEILWRLARSTYERAKRMRKGSKQMNETFRLAFSYAERSLELDEENFSAHKWIAILLNQVSEMQGLKEQIIQSEKVKNHMKRAVELNPKDATSVYLLGHWCYTVAMVPYWQRKAAETFIAKPPTCEFKEAIELFLHAEKIKPFFYSMNLLMLARCYIQLNDYRSAYRYITALDSYRILTEEDREAVREARYIWKKNKLLFEQIRKDRIAEGLTIDLKGRLG